MTDSFLAAVAERHHRVSVNMGYIDARKPKKQAKNEDPRDRLMQCQPVVPFDRAAVARQFRCGMWQAGKCRWGQACNFTHDTNAPERPPMEDCWRIYIASVPGNMPEDVVLGMAATCGVVVDIKMLESQLANGRRSCFLRMTTEKAGASAISMFNNTPIDESQTLKAQWALPPNKPPMKPYTLHPSQKHSINPYNTLASPNEEKNATKSVKLFKSPPTSNPWQPQPSLTTVAPTAPKAPPPPPNLDEIKTLTARFMINTSTDTMQKMLAEFGEDTSGDMLTLAQRCARVMTTTK
jgi:hypothetical protein